MHVCVCICGKAGERAKGKRRKQRPQSQIQDFAQFSVNFLLFPKDKYFNQGQSDSWGTKAKENTFAYVFTSTHPLLKLHRNCCIMKYSSQATMFILKQLTHGTFPAVLLSLALSMCLLHILSLGRLKCILTNLTAKRCWFEMYSLLFFRNSNIYFIPFSGESWTVVLVLQGKDTQNKLCKGFKPRNFQNVTFWTRYPLVLQGCAPLLCIMAIHISPNNHFIWHW